MSRRSRRAVQGSDRFPRVSGDEPVTEQTAEGSDLFSPRERG